jgi:hypothetical protein
MKTNKLLYLVTVLGFTLLFYKKGNTGINFGLFAILLIVFSGIMNKSLWKTKQWLIISAGTLIASFSVVYYASGLAIFMGVISFLILMTLQRSKCTSYFISLASSMISIIGSVIFNILGRLYRIKYLRPSPRIVRQRKWPVIIIVVVVTLLFLTLYRNASPIFNSYFMGIFDHFDWGWIFFTIFGSFLLYSFFFRPPLLNKLLRLEPKHDHTIKENSLKPYDQSLIRLFSNLESERYSALLLFVILNLLLLFLNITDIHYLFFKGELPKGITYSDYVHSGVEAVIMSIVFAILLIAYYFRAAINFDSKSKNIKALTYLWIVQNIVLIVMAAVKNQLYIDAYSLTYLRIGVYYYLAFSIIGLILTFYKIYFKKDTWFLFRSNSFVFYWVLILSCLFNWNIIVTRYNLKYSHEIDYSYLNSLGHQNYPILWESKFYDSINKEAYQLRLTGKYETYYLPETIGTFLEDCEKSESITWCATREKTYQYFEELAKSNKLTK